MKVVFLDIDGVLNCQATLKFARQSADRYAQMLDMDMIQRLNKLLENTGAVCVLSSSWRILLTPEQMEETLRARGFTGRIIDRTGACGSRGNEIRDWLLSRTDVEAFVILDDEISDMAGVAAHVVRTSMQTGLQDEHVKEAVNILETKQ